MEGTYVAYYAYTSASYMYVCIYMYVYTHK